MDHLILSHLRETGAFFWNYERWVDKETFLNYVQLTGSVITPDFFEKSKGLVSEADIYVDELKFFNRRVFEMSKVDDFRTSFKQHQGITLRKREGFWIVYPEKNTGFYVAGNKEGKWNSFWPDGSIKEQGQYIEGERVGTWTVYQEGNGEIESTGSYFNGEKDGIWTVFDYDKEVYYKVTYKEGYREY